MGRDLDRTPMPVIAQVQAGTSVDSKAKISTPMLSINLKAVFQGSAIHRAEWEAWEGSKIYSDKYSTNDHNNLQHVLKIS